MKQLFVIDPLADPRWKSLIETHSCASIFHTGSWLSALVDVYGYRPLALTSSPLGQDLMDGVAFCEIRSRLTGARLVAIPFADHAEPLLGDPSERLSVEDWAHAECLLNNWKYVEIRHRSDRSECMPVLNISTCYWLHTLSLMSPLEVIFANMHKSCMQRRIRHAEHQNLVYERGRSEKNLCSFYRLLVRTRRRHGVPPQPYAWFRKLISLPELNAEIRVARKGVTPVAAIFTLRHRNVVTYKYGGSDDRFHHLGAIPFLFWRLVEESKDEGGVQLDLGRTEISNHGLVEFKDRLGATRTKISYQRFQQSGNNTKLHLMQADAATRIIKHLPNNICTAIGSLLYKHFG